MKHFKGQQKSKVMFVTTGTGSGKSLSFFIPVVDAILKAKDIDNTARMSDSNLSNERNRPIAN